MHKHEHTATAVEQVKAEMKQRAEVETAKENAGRGIFSNGMADVDEAPGFDFDFLKEYVAERRKLHTAIDDARAALSQEAIDYLGIETIASEHTEPEKSIILDVADAALAANWKQAVTAANDHLDSYLESTLERNREAFRVESLQLSDGESDDLLAPMEDDIGRILASKKVDQVRDEAFKSFTSEHAASAFQNMEGLSDEVKVQLAQIQEAMSKMTPEQRIAMNQRALARMEQQQYIAKHSKEVFGRRVFVKPRTSKTRKKK